MNGPIWVGWALVGLLAVISIGLLIGKESFVLLLAGYNTASKEQKKQYNLKRLSRVAGTGLGIVTFIVGLDLAYEANLPSSIQWLVPWGYLIILSAIFVLGNTICKKTVS